MSEEIKNAVIEDAWIGFEDHGILTSYLVMSIINRQKEYAS